MKYVSSKEDFIFKHNGSLTVHLTSEPLKVEDEVASHLVQVFGGRIIVSDETTVGSSENPTPTPEESVPTTASEEAVAPAEETSPAESEVTE
jgi:hypothetical protein